jgi:general secretion pathway protein B
MSSILDALRKSERQRRQARTPVFRDAAMPASPPLLRWASLLAWAALLLALVGGAVLILRTEVPVPAAVPANDVTPAGAPPQSAAVTPAAPVTARLPDEPVTPRATATQNLAGQRPTADDGRARAVAGPQSEPVSSLPAVSGEAPWLSALPESFRAGLPPLTVTIHVYAPDEAQRILYINNRPYRRGAEIQPGVVVEEIVPEGVVLRYRGQRFRLPRPS